MRFPPPLPLALIAAATLFLACTGGDGADTTPPVTPPQTAPPPQTGRATPDDVPPNRDPAPADQSTGTPQIPPPTALGVVGADPGSLPADTKLRLGESRTLTPIPAPGRWVQLDAETAASDDLGGNFFQIVYYDRDTDTFWAARSPEGAPLWGSSGPDGRTLVAWSLDPTARGETVLIDLATGDALRILPFPVDYSTRWLALGLLELEIPTRDPDPAQNDPGWRAGFYHLDTASWTITYVAEAGRLPDRFALPAPLPAGSPLPGAVEVELRWRPGGRVIVLLTSNDAAEHELAGPYDTLVPSPTGARIAIVDGRRQLHVYDFARGEFLPVGEPRDGWYPVWSPDGRYLARQTSGVDFSRPVTPTPSPSPIHITIYDVEPSLPAPRTVGAYAQSELVGWRPDGTEALLLSGHCDPDDAFYLERVLLATGARIRIPTAVQGFWNYRWSPRNDVIAVTARDLPLGLIEPDTGAVVDAPGLARFRSLRDFQWVDGRWLAIYPVAGRDRCN